MIIKIYNIFIIIMFAGLISCKNNNDENFDWKIKTDLEFAAELRSYPEIITIDNNKFILTTYLWRDFMPITEENGKPMNCINYLTDKDSLTIGCSIELKKQYVIKGDEIWRENYSEISNPNNFTIEGIVRNGPKWGPNITVDVVCEFNVNNKIYRILAKSQKIHKTE